LIKPRNVKKSKFWTLANFFGENGQSEMANIDADSGTDTESAPRKVFELSHFCIFAINETEESRQ
jgi:hypothetical protein